MMRRALSLKVAAALLVALVSGACEVDFVPRAEAREEWKKSYTLAAGGELTIENTNGKIVVRPGTGPTVEVVATRISKAGSDDAARQLLTDMKMEETVSASGVKISSRQARLNMGGRQYRVDYEVRAPLGAALNLSATNGEIDVAEWEGRVEMSATNGKLRGAAIKGEVDASTTNGEITIRLASLNERGVKVQTTNGEVSVEVPKDAKGRVVARVTNGDISISGLNVEASPANTRRRYEGILNGGGGPTINVETTNGTVNVRGM